MSNKESDKQAISPNIIQAVYAWGRVLPFALIRKARPHSLVATMSFQGVKAFYEKLGYVVNFERPGYT